MSGIDKQQCFTAYLLANGERPDSGIRVEGRRETS